MNGNQWVLGAILVTALALSAHAGVIINTHEVGANVVASASGTLNATGWLPADTTRDRPGIVPSLGIVWRVLLVFTFGLDLVPPRYLAQQHLERVVHFLPLVARMSGSFCGRRRRSLRRSATFLDLP